jgi:hypothetical protein
VSNWLVPGRLALGQPCLRWPALDRLDPSWLDLSWLPMGRLPLGRLMARRLTMR